MSTRPQSDIKVFRGAVFSWLVYFFAGGTAVGFPLALCVLLALFGLDLSVVALFGGLLVGGLVHGLISVANAYFLAFCFPTRLSAERVFGYSVWGTPRSLRWQEISEVRPFRLLNIRFLRLYPGSRTSPTWIVMNLADRTAFENEVCRLAPSDSPIRPHL
jgi:hypothetical protein